MFSLVPFNKRSNGVTLKNDLWNLDRVFEDFFSDSFLSSFSNASYSIKADIRETEKEYIIDADIPGVKKEDIKLELKDEVLTIGVEHKEEIKEEKENYLRKERKYGAYSRSFYVENAKHEEVQAKYNDGVLSITIPKKEVRKPEERKIEIQ